MQSQGSQKVTPQYMSIKAGMDSVNKEVIGQKVAALTRGTPKDLHEKQLQKKRALEVAQMIEKTLKFTDQQRKNIKEHWEKKIRQISQQRPLHRFWAHFDFDMFYVACELLEKPELKQLPVAVGSEDGVLCTSNYAARLKGIRSAMPTFIAKTICPELILFKPDFQKYRHFSEIFREVLRRFDQNIEYQGLDEAYVDMTEHFQDATEQQQQQIIENIRKQVFQKTGLTISGGVGANKMLAKMASEVKKPNGQFILPNDVKSILEFMKGIKIRKIPGIGPVNEYYLKGLGMENAEDMLKKTDILQICFSDNSCEFFIEAALGLGNIDHSNKQRKSVGRSQTFRPTNDAEYLTNKLNEICSSVSIDLEELGFMSLNAVFSYQDENYEKKDKTFNLDGYSKDKDVFSKTTKNYLLSVIAKKKIRLIGVRCSQLMKIEEWKKKSLQNYFAKQQNPHADESRQYLLNEVREKSEFVCPICNKQIDCKSNISALNRHIDKCLKGNSRGPEIKQEKSMIEEEPQSKKRGKSKTNESKGKLVQNVHKNLDSFFKKSN